jgi:hypothetical protein
MGEISAASNEQSLGVAQVGEAVGQMDQTTQQNAALVEQMAAAASSLKEPGQDLVQVVAVFKLGSSLTPLHLAVGAVPGVHLGRDFVFNARALDLHGGRQEAVFDGPGLLRDHDHLQLFVVDQTPH